MSRGAGRSRVRRDAQAELARLLGGFDNSYVIHYSCESFHDRVDPRSPRITSIAIKHMNSGQATSFSIHQVAERAGQLQDIEGHYDELERSMLSDYFSYVAQKANVRWIHWHMRDANYGFAALEQRFLALGGVPSQIADHLKTDMPVLLSELYGHRYAPDPHMSRLADLNSVSKLNFLPGKEEAEAFEKKEYVKLHLSTLRKVNVIADLLKRLRDGTLKTAAPWQDTYGVTVQGMYDRLVDNVWWKILSPLGVIFSLVTIATVVLGKLG